MAGGMFILFHNSKFILQGEFTVKSAYHIAHKLIDSMEEGESSLGDPRTPLWQSLCT